MARRRSPFARLLRRVPAFYLDAAERVTWTFAQAAVGALTDELTSGQISWRAVGYAGAAAILKAYGARRIGSSDSASTLPEPPR